jgi:hypothetical protein
LFFGRFEGLEEQEKDQHGEACENSHNGANYSKQLDEHYVQRNIQHEGNQIRVEDGMIVPGND